MLTYVNVVVTGLAIVLIAAQCRKPRWWIGRLMVSMMNRSHSGLTDWGLRGVAITPASSVLDVGCGGGRTIEKLAGTGLATHVCGVDYSAASVAAARRTNAAAIAAGRVEIVAGTVSRLPFPDAGFDLVTAFETHYYWPDIVADLREVRRVLKPGGQLVIVAEAYRRDGTAGALAGLLMRGLGGTLLTAPQHRAALEDAGFVDVAVDEERRKGWIRVRGTR